MSHHPDMPSRALPCFLLAATLLGCGDAKTPPSAPTVSPDELRRLAPEGAADGYNLLFISVDTLRADHVGCYGYAAAETPAIDSLARSGVLFEHGVAAAPITLPAHSSMMTGLDVPTHGVRNNGTFRLGEEHRTLAEVLRAAGYETAAFVGAYVLDGHYGLDRGFDVYDDDVNPEDAVVSETRYSERTADHVSGAALAWLEDAATRPAPFFAWLHYFDPHGPYEPPPPFRERFSSAPYDGEIAFADREIGRVLDFLDSAGLRERTLVVFTADHGESLGEHGETSHALLIYDATVRVPLIVSAPSLFAEAVRYADGAVGHPDLLPSLTHLLGLDAPAGLDGRNVFAHPPDGARTVYVETLAPLLHHGWSPLHGLRRAGSKLIHAPTKEYYDLVADPGELDNLYSKGGSELAALDAALAERLVEMDSPLASLEAAAPLTPEERARLAALGYVDVGNAPERPSLADPKDMMPVWNRIKYAEQLCLGNRCEDAIREIEAVLAEHGTVGSGWYTASRIYRTAGRLAEARAAIARAVELDPSSEGFVTQAQFALMARDEKTFEAAIAAAEELDPDNGRIYLARGDRLAIAGDYRASLREFRRAVEVDPHRSGPIAEAKIAELEKRLATR